MTDIVPSPTIINISIDSYDDRISSTDYLGETSQSQSSKQTYSKGASMDGGDAANSGDCSEKDNAAAKLRRPLLATIGDCFIECEAHKLETKAIAEVELSPVEIGGPRDQNAMNSECNRHAETEEDDLGLLEEENEIKNLVEFVLHKVKMELIQEKNRNPPVLADKSPKVGSMQNSNGCKRDSSPDNDEYARPVTMEKEEYAESFPHGETRDDRVKNKPNVEAKAGSLKEKAEQHLDSIIKFIIEKQCRDLTFQFHSEPTQETGVGGDVSTSHMKMAGLDFGFHSVMKRLTENRVEDSWGDENDIGEGIEFLDVTNGAQPLDMSHQEEESKGVHQPHMVPVQHDEVEESLDRVEEIHDEVKQAQKDEFQNSRGGISDTNDGQACDVELSLEVESANWVPNEISAEVNHFLRHGSGEMGALEVPPEVQGEAIKDEAKEKRKIEYDQNLKDGEDEDESCSEENTDDDDDNLVTSEEDELDSMVGYVINSAGSSLTNNFDVFTFKSFHINENITSRKEGPEEDSIILDGDAAPDAEEVLLIHSGDENLRGETLNVSDVYAGDDVIEASDMFRQGTCFVAADSSSVKHEDTEGVNDKICASFKNVDNVTLRVEGANERKKTDDDSLHDKCSTEKPQDDSFSRSVENRKPLEIKVTDNAADLIGLEGTHESLEQGSPTWSKKQEDAMCVKKKQENDGGPSLTHTAEVLEANLQLPPIDTVCRTSKVQSQEVTETLLQKLENDLPKCNKEEKTSSVTDMTSSVNGPKVTLTVSNIASDSDDDDDLYDTERKPSVNINTVENDWECLAIQQISKSQPHVWYPTYNTTHHIVEDASKTQHNNTGKHLDADTLKMNIPSKVPSNEKVTSTHDVSESTVTAKSLSSHNLTTGQSMPSVSSQARASQPDLPETESGMAVINDRLRKKIVLLERRLKELALELTFLGDRNWRLEAYIDCLIKTLEVLEVTDVVDLDQKTLPLSLFKVKVKAGYKLGSYNGIPSRALQSYKKEGRQPPYVDLSGWGDTDKPTQRPDLIDPTPLPSCDDDVGLSVSQMYHYESQLEEISIQNQILEGQLQEANELVQSMMGESSADERQTGPQDLHQAKQQKEQGIQTRPHDTSTLPQNVGVLQQQVQDLRDEYHQGGQEYWQQPQQEQQQQLFLTGVMPQIQTQPECYAMHEGEQYSLPQQQLQHYQLQHCQPVVQPQQQQLQQPQQQAWNPQAVQEETVLPNCCDWESNEKLSLHDPLEWPTLTESQAQVTGRSQTGTGTEAGPRPLQLQTQPFAATGPASHVSESSPTVLSNPVKDKSTLHSSLEQPASSGSIPNHENRCKASCYHDNNPKEASSSGTVSSQSFYRGRRFESDSRGQPRYNHRSLEQSLSGIDTLPRGHRLEESMRFEHWDPHVDRLSSLIPGEFPVDLHGEAWRKERSPYHDVRNAPSRHPLPFQRNLDRNRRFFHCDSVLDSYCPDFSNFQHAPTFKEDLGETISASNSQFMLSNGYAFDKFPSPPSTRGFSSLGSSTSTGALPYPRQHKRQSTPTRRGKPWTRAGSCTSPLRSRHNPEVTLSDSK